MSMSFNECVRARRSVRKYKPDPIPGEVLERVISEASYSPSWKNSQTVRYVLVENPALKEEIAASCMAGFPPNAANVRSAPAVILVTTITGRAGYERDGSPTTSKGSHWESFDAGIATQTLCLAAEAEGLGTLIMGIYDEARTIEAASIPEGQSVAAIVAIGYADEAPPMPKRKTVEDLLDVRR